jgi:hypothetical protein|tara:strand:+ start:3967 stop:4155 length:189 start_codon:yes stop_codon:yes gene_type:complete
MVNVKFTATIIAEYQQGDNIRDVKYDLEQLMNAMLQGGKVFMAIGSAIEDVEVEKVTDCIRE